MTEPAKPNDQILDQWTEQLEALNALSATQWNSIDLAIQDTKVIFSGRPFTFSDVDDYVEESIPGEVPEQFSSLTLLFAIAGVVENWVEFGDRLKADTSQQIVRLRERHEAWLSYLIAIGSRPRDWSRLEWSKVSSTRATSIRLELFRVDGRSFELEMGAESALRLASRVARWVIENEEQLDEPDVAGRYAASFEEIALELRSKSNPAS